MIATSTSWFEDALLADGTGVDPVRTGLLVEDGKVTRVGGQAPDGAEVIDAGGSLVTPDLIDAHVHLGLSSNLTALTSHQLSPAEIAADIFANLSSTLDCGFTTVRDCGGIDGGVTHAVASGKIRGPRTISCGPIQCQRGGHGHFAPLWEPTELFCGHGVPGLWEISMLSDGPDTMRANVRESFRRGAEFIKLCATGGVVSTHDKVSDTQLTIEEMAVAVYEAKSRGTYVTIHAHNNEGVRNGIEAGVECVEHGSLADEEIAALMKKRNIAHVPTLATIERLMNDAESAGLSADFADRARVVWQGMIDAIKASAAAGVLLGSGSDLLGPNQIGRGGELTLRAEIQSPMEALVSATRNNARVLRIEDLVGTVEVGKQADLVLWARNPLEDAELFNDPATIAVVMQSGIVVRDAR